MPGGRFRGVPCMTGSSSSTTAGILALFAERGASLVDVPILQPADPFLDTAGEDLRRRIFLTEGETGLALCLRPEFTIPVCLDHIASQAGTPRRYAYLGAVFRQRREGSSEFLQAGMEDLGDEDAWAADARSLADARALLALTLPGRRLAITLGDQAVFEGVLAALGLPRGWRNRLARAFGAPDALRAALAELSRPSDPGPLPEPALAGDMAALSAHVATELERAGIAPTAGRTPEEIARRLLEKAELSRTRLSPQAFSALEAFLGIDVPLENAAAKLAGFARGAGISLGAALDGFAVRAQEIARHGIDPGAIRYDAAFGRPLDYYTGLVFEITAQGASGPLAGGGRYDRLLNLLGAGHSIPGVGFSVWLDRVEALRGRPA